MSQGWSLRSYLTRWIALTSCGIAVIVAGSSAFVVQGAIEREVAALADEELGEAKAMFSATAGRYEDFEGVALDLEHSHPENPFAWHVWHREGGELWGAFGELDMFKEFTPDHGSLEPVSSGELRWAAEPLNDDLMVGILIDASTQLNVAQRFYVLAATFVVLAVLVSMFVASWVGSRASRQLADVAEQVRTIRRPEDELQLSISSAPDEIRDVAGALREMLANIQDEAANSQLITSGLAHELRSPIQNLMGETEVALMRDRDPEEYRQVLHSNMEELRHLSRAVDNLVMLCGAGEARRSRGRERFDLGKEADMRLDREHSHAARRNVRILVHKEGDLGFDGDREAILLVMRNLVINAVDWSPEGGEVHVDLAGNNGQVEFKVEDQGPGVPSTERDKIFEAFYRSPSLNGGRVGYGLGLALTRSAVESHGGEIRVVESPAGGASFRVSLPRAS